jgi:hypothetical protein
MPTIMCRSPKKKLRISALTTPCVPSRNVRSSLRVRSGIAARIRTANTGANHGTLNPIMLMFEVEPSEWRNDVHPHLRPTPVLRKTPATIVSTMMGRLVRNMMGLILRERLQNFL